MSSGKQQLQFPDAEQVVSRFNERFPVGSTVMWRAIGIKAFEYKSYEVRTAAFLSKSGEPVACLKGIGGYVSVLEEFVKY